MQNSYQLNDDLKKRLERATRATLGLRNRKQNKMVVSYTHEDDVDCSEVDSNEIQFFSNPVNSSNRANSTITSNPSSETRPPERELTPAENPSKDSLGWGEWLKKQCLGNFTERELEIIKQPFAVMAKVHAISNLVNSLPVISNLVNFLPVATAAPITNYTLIDGSTNCTTFEYTNSDGPIFDCQRFSVWSNGLQILTGKLYRGYGRWDADPNDNGGSGSAGMPDGVCKGVFDACNSYSKMKERIQTLLSHENATDFLTSNFNENDFSNNGACRDHLAVMCLAENDLYGLNQAGCFQFIGCNPYVDGNTLTNKCFDVVSKKLKEEEGLRTLGKIGIGFGVALPSLYILNKLYKRHKAKKEQEAKAAREAKAAMEAQAALDAQAAIEAKIAMDAKAAKEAEEARLAAIRKAQFEERQNLYRTTLSGVSTMLLATRKMNAEKNPIPDEIISKVLEFLTKEETLSTWALTQANKIQGYQITEESSSQNTNTPSTPNTPKNPATASTSNSRRSSKSSSESKSDSKNNASDSKNNASALDSNKISGDPKKNAKALPVVVFEMQPRTPARHNDIVIDIPPSLSDSDIQSTRRASI